MKTYITYLISAIFITLTLWSCDDDFLDKQPLDEISIWPWHPVMANLITRIPAKNSGDAELCIWMERPTMDILNTHGKGISILLRRE